MSTRLMLILCAVLAGPALGVSTAAIAAPAEATPARVRVVVDADALGDAAAFFEDEVGARIRAALEQAGHEVVDGVDADATVRVRITFFNEADLDYQVDVDISAGAQLVQLEMLACPQCVDDDLLGKIEGQQAEVVAGLERALARSEQDGGPAPTGDGDPTPPGSETKPIGALGGVGVGVAALGIGALVAGGVEFGRGRVYDDPTTNPTERSYIDHRPAGAALLGVGGVLVVAGVGMLTADLVIRSKKRRHAQQARVVYPLLGGGTLGLGYSGKF